MKGLNIEKFDWDALSSPFSILELSNGAPAFDFLSAFEPFSALSPFSADFLDFASPLSSLDFLDLPSLGGLSPAFYFDLLFDFSLISFII